MLSFIKHPPTKRFLHPNYPQKQNIGIQLTCSIEKSIDRSGKFSLTDFGGREFEAYCSDIEIIASRKIAIKGD